MRRVRSRSSRVQSGDYSAAPCLAAVIEEAMPIIETIPNVSEGRRPEVVEQLVAAVRATPRVRLLDYSSDTSHNRSVLTMVGDAPSLKQAILTLYETALPLIDLRTQRGEHPRCCFEIGVVPRGPRSARRAR